MFAWVEPERHDEVEAWMVERIDNMRGLGFGEAQYAEMRSQGERIAALSYFNWDPNSRTLHIACAASTPRWARPASMRFMLSYPFRIAKARSLWAGASGRNIKSLRLIHCLGFQHHARLPDYYADGDDMMIYGMTREQWLASRWN